MMLVNQILLTSVQSRFLLGMILEVEKTTGALGGDFDDDGILAGNGLKEAHRKIVEVDAHLSGGFLDFELRLLACLRRSFEPGEYPLFFGPEVRRDHEELQAMVDFHTEMSHGHEDARKSYSRRLDLQLKIVSILARPLQ